MKLCACSEPNGFWVAAHERRGRYRLVWFYHNATNGRAESIDDDGYDNRWKRNYSFGINLWVRV
jgi:hypothetical protein